jgi:hypothetical protein
VYVDKYVHPIPATPFFETGKHVQLKVQVLVVYKIENENGLRAKCKKCMPNH